METKGNGYIERSMSVNAKECHDRNIKPLSAWSRMDFVDTVENELGARIKSMKGSYKDYLIFDSWHHTSKFYQVTDFYRIDLEKVEQAIKDGTVVCYTEAELEALDKNEVKRIEKEQAQKRERERKEAEELAVLKAEVAGAEKVVRVSRKGREVITVLITQKEPGLYKRLMTGAYVPVKTLLDGLPLAELKLKD